MYVANGEENSTVYVSCTSANNEAKQNMAEQALHGIIVVLCI